MKTKTFTAPNGKGFLAVFENGICVSVFPALKNGEFGGAVKKSHYAFEFASTQLWG